MVMRETKRYINAFFVHLGVDEIGPNVTHRYIKAVFVHLEWTGSALM
jgi:hypothetical protein